MNNKNSYIDLTNEKWGFYRRSIDSLTKYLKTATHFIIENDNTTLRRIYKPRINRKDHVSKILEPIRIAYGLSHTLTVIDPSKTIIEVIEYWCEDSKAFAKTKENKVFIFDKEKMLRKGRVYDPSRKPLSPDDFETPLNEWHDAERGGDLDYAKTPEFEEDIARFYKSMEWYQMRLMVLHDHPYQCVVCNDDQFLHVDHIKPIRYFWSLRLDYDNLQLLCGPCNLEKGSATNWSKDVHQNTLLKKGRMRTSPKAGHWRFYN